MSKQGMEQVSEVTSWYDNFLKSRHNYQEKCFLQQFRPFQYSSLALIPDGPANTVMWQPDLHFRCKLFAHLHEGVLHFMVLKATGMLLADLYNIVHAECKR